MSSRSALFDPCWLIDTGKGLGWQWIAQGTIRRETTVVEASEFVSCQATALQTEGGKLLGYDFCSQVELLLRFFQTLCRFLAAFVAKWKETSQSVLLRVTSLI